MGYSLEPHLQLEHILTYSWWDKSSERACIVFCQPLGGTAHLGLLKLFFLLEMFLTMLLVM
jgi:hypothetical protein